MQKKKKSNRLAKTARPTEEGLKTRAKKKWNRYAKIVAKVVSTGQPSHKRGPRIIRDAKSKGWKPPRGVVREDTSMGKNQVLAAKYLRVPKLSSNKRKHVAKPGE